MYACHAGLSLAELKLTIKPKPGDAMPTQEDYDEEDTLGKLIATKIIHKLINQNLKCVENFVIT